MKKILVGLVVVFGLAGVVMLSMVQADIPAAEIEQRYAYPDSQFIDVDGLRVHYRDVGQGVTTVVLVHGTSASLHTWEGWIDDLSSDYRVVAMDLPAFGLTGPSPSQDYTVPGYVQFVEDFARAVSLDSFALAGNSLGGFIAWQYAATHTGQVSHLVLVDPAGQHRDDTPVLIKLGQWPIISDLLPHITPRWVIQNQVENVYGDVSRIQEGVVDRYHALILRAGNRKAFQHYARHLDHNGPVELLPHITAPTLVMWGDQDRLIPLSHAAKYEAAIPDARVVVYKDVGHVPMEEIPQRSVQDVRALLDAGTSGVPPQGL